MIQRLRLPERAVEAIRGQAGDLGAALALWAARDDARPCPEARRAASAAIDTIDACSSRAARPPAVAIMRSGSAMTPQRPGSTSCSPGPSGRIVSPRGRHAAGSGPPADPAWARTSDRRVWRAYKNGLMLTVTRIGANHWVAVVEGQRVVAA